VVRRLELESAYVSRAKRAQLLRSVPIFRPFLLQKHALQSIHRSETPPLFTFGFPLVLPIPWYSFFDIPSFKNKRMGRTISIAEVRSRFREFSALLVNGGISLYTDGSRRDEDDVDSAVGAAVYSSDLALALKHKLPAETSIFSAEA